MHIQTSRFGVLSVDPGQVITFPRGLVGFADLSRFVVLASEENVFFSWLQSVQDPDVAFLVTDPTLFFKDYSVVIREETQAEIGIQTADAGRVLVICNKVGDWLTGNLLGPIVVNENNGLGQQVVLTEKKWTTRQPLAKLYSEVWLAKAA
ncbi:MAG TPA: flagellar assembly protein FliW [Tepidisphaeraceae bacterium]|jgi:flagellar assembly factor FliW